MSLQEDEIARDRSERFGIDLTRQEFSSGNVCYRLWLYNFEAEEGVGWDYQVDDDEGEVIVEATNHYQKLANVLFSEAK